MYALAMIFKYEVPAEPVIICYSHTEEALKVIKDMLEASNYLDDRFYAIGRQVEVDNDCI